MAHAKHTAKQEAPNPGESKGGKMMDTRSNLHESSSNSEEVLNVEGGNLITAHSSGGRIDDMPLSVNRDQPCSTASTAPDPIGFILSTYVINPGSIKVL